MDGGTYNEGVTLSDGKSLIAQEFSGTSDSPPIIDGGQFSVAITVPNGGSAGTIQGFTIRSEPRSLNLFGPATVTQNIFDETADTFVLAVSGTAADASVIHDNDFIGAGGTVNQWAIIADMGSSPTISANTFAGYLNAVVVQGGGAPSVTGNTITGLHSSGFNLGVGVYVGEASQATVVGNTIRSPAAGSPLGVYASTAASVALRRNRIFDHFYGLYAQNTATVSLNSDLIAGGGGPAIYAADEGPPYAATEGDVSASGVTLAQTGVSPVAQIQLSNTDLLLDSSILMGTISQEGSQEGSCEITYSRGEDPQGGLDCDPFQTNADPQFISTDTSTPSAFHLAPGSPMIDAGNPASPPAPNDLDIDAQPRALDGSPGCDQPVFRRDIGADEFVSTTVPGCAGPPGNPPAQPRTKKKCKKPKKKSAAAAKKKCKRRKKK